MSAESADLLRRSFLDSVYGLTDIERAEMALGLVCLSVSKLDGHAEIISGHLYVSDEVRYEYFGRPDLDNESSLPSDFKGLVAEIADSNLLVELSAALLNAVDNYVDAYFPGSYYRNLGTEN